MIQATDYEILRDVVASIAVKRPMDRMPKRVAVLLNEAEFKRSKGVLDHLNSVFLDDRNHDWLWKDGFFHYFSHAVHVGGKADVVIAYETVTVEPTVNSERRLIPKI